VRGSKKKGEAHPRRLAVAAGVLVPLSAFALYLSTLAPTVLPYDSGTLQAKSYVLGIGHPTGYPTFIMLGHLFTYLPFGDVAYRVNLSSATYAALSALFVYLAALRLVPNRRTPAGVLSAATGAFAFAVGPTLWSQAAITEVYTLNALFLAATVYLLLLWRDTRRDLHLLLAALTSGLAVTAHATSGLLLPAALAYVLSVAPRTLLRPGLVLKALGAGLIGLLPYLYLPIRASMDPPLNYGNPSTLSNLLDLLSGGNFRGQMFQLFGPEELPGRVGLYLNHLADQLPPLLFLAAAGGLVALVLRDRAPLALLGVLALGTVGYALGYDIPDIAAYFIPSYLAASLLAAAGLGYAVAVAGHLVGRRAPDLVPFAAAVVLVPALLSLALVVPVTRADVDQSDNYESRRLVESIARIAEPGASIIAGHDTASLQYMQFVEGRRTDLTLLMTNDEQMLRNAEKGTSRGPTYVIKPGLTQTGDLKEAGYRLTEVDRDIYKLSGGPESRP